MRGEEAECSRKSEILKDDDSLCCYLGGQEKIQIFLKWSREKIGLREEKRSRGGKKMPREKGPS